MAEELKQVADLVTANTIFALKKCLQVMRRQSIWEYLKLPLQTDNEAANTPL